MASGYYDRFNIHAQLEHLQSKYDGAGNADMTKWEWGSAIARDALASHVGHFSRLLYLSAADNIPVGRLRFECLQNMIRPCGSPPQEETLGRQ